MRLSREFFCRDVLVIAPEMIGKILVRQLDGCLLRFLITEIEAYRGEEDKACHARYGKTERNKVMYEEGGLVYVYLVYGIHWMLNFVTGLAGQPQALLIRSLQGINGPGKITRRLSIGKDLYGEDLCHSTRIWVEENEGQYYQSLRQPRIGINYAPEPWKSMPWRFTLLSQP